MTVKVKHIIEYLQTLDPEAEVSLDKDGWMESDFTEGGETEVDLVKNRGLFHYGHYQKEPYLIINN